MLTEDQRASNWKRAQSGKHSRALSRGLSWSILFSRVHPSTDKQNFVPNIFSHHLQFIDCALQIRVLGRAISLSNPSERLEDGGTAGRSLFDS